MRWGDVIVAQQSRFDERGLLVQLLDANGVGLTVTWGDGRY
jgi:hypothetical protein